MELLGTSVITDVVNATLLRFDDDVSGYGENLVAEFPETANAGWSIRDSHFFDAYQRLFVQSGPGEIVNNTFTRVGSSISIRSTVRSRNEGGNPSGIVVANNTLLNMSMSPGGGGVSSSPVTIGRLGETPVVNYSGIVISGNKMSLAGGAAIFAEHVLNLTVDSNRIISPCKISADVDPEAGTTARQAVYLSHAVDASVQHNQLVDKSESCKDDPVTHTAMLGLGKVTSAVTLDGRALPPTKTDDDAHPTSLTCKYGLHPSDNFDGTNVGGPVLCADADCCAAACCARAGCKAFTRNAGSGKRDCYLKSAITHRRNPGCISGIINGSAGPPAPPAPPAPPHPSPSPPVPTAGYLDAVTDCGCDSTGKTDTTKQLQACVDRAYGHTLPRVPVVLPRGEYLLSDT